MADDHAYESLIEAAVAGDRLALGELLLEYAPRLSRQIAARLPTKYRHLVAVEDILQEVFYEASLNVSQLRAPHRRVLSAWLAQIADYRAMHAVTRLRAQKRGGSQSKAFSPAAESAQGFLDLFEAAADRGETPSRPLKRKEAILAVQVSLATLPSVQREAVMYHHLDGKSVVETASAMGRTAAAVRGLLHRAKCSLRTSLGNSSRWFHNR
jgi:RNA polymerase sigma-70 factor (ECF subfamily)